MNPGARKNPSSCKLEGGKQNLGYPKRRRTNGVTCSKSSPNLGDRQKWSKEPEEVSTSVLQTTSVLIQHVLNTSRALVDLVITSIIGAPKEEKSSDPPHENPYGENYNFPDMTSEDYVRLSALKKASTDNPWLIPILQSAWEQVCTWVMSLGVASANVLQAVFRVWSSGVNRLLKEIFARDNSGTVIGFEFMDLLQLCLIFLNNYLRLKNDQKAGRSDKTNVYRMFAMNMN